MNAFLQDESIQRYALWAFSTFNKVNIRIIRINPYDAIDLPSKVSRGIIQGFLRMTNICKLTSTML